MALLYEDLKLCNCAGCGVELVSAEQQLHPSQQDHPPVEGKIAVMLRGINGLPIIHRRPYCKKCLHRELGRNGNS